MAAVFPLALLVVVLILLAAMPWQRPHPNHLFMLELLRSQLEDEQVGVDDSKSMDPIGSPESRPKNA
jgi:hypothetical protein